ncbi:MAG: hypothetical protein WDM87_01180 [Terracidiphilus sp.]
MTCIPTSPTPQTTVWLNLRRTIAVRRFFLTPVINSWGCGEERDAGHQHLRNDELPGILCGLVEVVEPYEPDGRDDATKELQPRVAFLKCRIHVVGVERNA